VEDVELSLSGALLLGPAGKVSPDVGDHQGRDERDAALCDHVEGPLIRQKGMLDAGHSCPRRADDRLAPLGVAEHAASKPRGLADDRVELALGHLLDAGDGGRQHRSLAGDHLDDVGAVTNVGTHSSDEARLPVGLASEPPAVSAGDRQRRARGQEAWSWNVPLVDAVAQQDVEVARGARAPSRRHASFERPPRHPRGPQEHRRVVPEEPERILNVRIQGVVGVAVDQPWQERPAVTLDDGRAGGDRARRIGGLDGGDPLALDGHVEPGPRRVGDGVDHPDIPEDDHVYVAFPPELTSRPDRTSSTTARRSSR
jgi:hypothetical protein